MNVLDLFCGAAGGWSAGLKWSGMRTVAACEIDAWRRGVFAANHPGCRMYDDVRELTAERLLNDLGYLPDAVVGSPPCQELSAANSKGKGITDDHLFWDWARIVFEVRPVWCAAENSPRARTGGIDGILDALAAANYAFWPCVVGADNAGANHERKRMWLIAADAERFELWRQPGWGGRPDRPREALAGEYDPYANGLDRHAGTSTRRSPAKGRPDIGRYPSDDAQHPAGIEGLRLEGVLGRGGDQSAQAYLPDDPDTDGAGHTFGSRLGTDDGAELPAALRDIGRAWPDWNGGLAGISASCAAAGFGALDDGTTAIMAPSLRNRAIAALGDAVVPQIPRSIWRAIMIATQKAHER